MFRSSKVPTSLPVLLYILYVYRKRRGIVLLEFISSTPKCNFFCTDLVNGEVFSVQQLSSMWWRHLFLWPRRKHSLSPKSHYVNIGMHIVCAMAQAHSRRNFMAEARIQFRTIACEIYGGQSGTAIGFSLNTSGFSCQWHVNSAPCLSSSTCGSYQGKRAKPGNLPRKYRKSRSFGENYFSLVLRRSTCTVLVMSEFNQNRNVWTNISKNSKYEFSRKFLYGSSIMPCRTDGRADGRMGRQT